MVFSSSNCPSGGLQETVSEEEVISKTVNTVGGVSGSELYVVERDRNTVHAAMIIQKQSDN